MLDRFFVPRMIFLHFFDFGADGGLCLWGLLLGTVALCGDVYWMLGGNAGLVFVRCLRVEVRDGLLYVCLSFGASCCVFVVVCFRVECDVCVVVGLCVVV